ncbi:MAG: photosynthetic reaction center cytochrome c subunit [Acidobacteria bacterium]|nr:photosynthetic reaction center cytochrome c subunit [Acidobacteriota bacterium]
MKLVLSALLIVSQTVSQPVPQTAAERYKSIRVLKEIPSSDVIPVMSVIAGSLGVTCSHCHGAEFVSDDNPNKAKARQMIEMTRRVDQEFGGKGLITCNTCHQGRAIPPAVPLVQNAGWNRPPAVTALALPLLDSVIERYVTAMGGRTALARMTTRTIAGSVTRMNGRTPPGSGEFAATASFPGSGSVDTAFSYPPEAEGEMVLSFVRPLRVRELYPKLEVTRRERVNGKDAVAVAATTTRGAIHTLFFDEASGLLLRRYSEKTTALGQLPEEFDFDDYREVNGVQVPHLIRWSRADYQVTFTVANVK